MRSAQFNDSTASRPSVLIWVNLGIFAKGYVISSLKRRTTMAPMPLILILHIFIGATLAGSGVVVALVLGFDTLAPILVAGVLGFLAAFPISWLVAREIAKLR